MYSLVKLALLGASEPEDPSTDTLELIVERTFLCWAPVLMCAHTLTTKSVKKGLWNTGIMEQ